MFQKLMKAAKIKYTNPSKVNYLRILLLHNAFEVQPLGNTVTEKKKTGMSKAAKQISDKLEKELLFMKEI